MCRYVCAVSRRIVYPPVGVCEAEHCVLLHVEVVDNEKSKLVGRSCSAVFLKASVLKSNRATILFIDRLVADFA